MTDMRLWRVAAPHPIDAAEVMAIAGESAADTPEDAPVRGVELQRIDTTPEGTVVFATGSEAGVRAFSARLMRGARDAPADYAETNVETLRAG